MGGDRVVAWLRAAHNGGAVLLRHFLSGPRVINDTYGLFFYDPDGGYVAAYKKDYGYSLYGWRSGVMIVKGKDGTLWSALTGLAIEGPQKGRRLQRIPNMTTTWEHWMMLHPESTAYDLFDGKTYAITPLPEQMSPEAKRSMTVSDRRLSPMANVMGVEVGSHRKAYPLDSLDERRARAGADRLAAGYPRLAPDIRCDSTPDVHRLCRADHRQRAMATPPPKRYGDRPRPRHLAPRRNLVPRRPRPRPRHPNPCRPPLRPRARHPLPHPVERSQGADGGSPARVH